MKILVQGWFYIPHSYAIVACYEIIYLYKKYKGEVELYLDEKPYFREHWNSNRKLVYPKEYIDILKKLPVWRGEKVDIVYSLTYPYNVTPVPNGIPRCVFYTSEFAWLNHQYFCTDNSTFESDSDVVKHLETHDTKLFFTPSSIWSAHGLTRFGVSPENNKVITLGVDVSIFKPHHTESVRESIRQRYSIRKDDILLVNIGSMTENKGIYLLLQTMHTLINVHNKKQFKLLLKGTNDLYESKLFLESYLARMQTDMHLTKEQETTMLENIIFVTQTLSCALVNDLFNACDAYISPYLAEGFSMTALESLGAGLPLIISKTGSTMEFINDIYDNGGKSFIFRIDSVIAQHPNGMHQNSIRVEDICKTLLDNETALHDLKTSRLAKYSDVQAALESRYTWERVVENVYMYFKDIIARSSH